MILRELLVGRTAKCPQCERDFTVTWEHLRRKTVKCLDCKIGEKKEEGAAEVTVILNPFEQLLKDKLG